MNETGLHFFDQIAFASRFLYKETFINILKSTVKDSIDCKEKLQTLVIVGNSKEASQVM